MDFCNQMEFYLFCSFIAHRKDKKISFTKLKSQNIFLVLLTLAHNYWKWGKKSHWNANVSVLVSFNFPFSKSLFKSQWFLCQCSLSHHSLSLFSEPRFNSVWFCLLYQCALILLVSSLASTSILSYRFLVYMYLFHCLELILLHFSLSI